ncbi:MAG: hypothetical protein AB7I41_12285 [Candidatus Sericytochromatia bacterium]
MTFTHLSGQAVKQQFADRTGLPPKMLNGFEDALANLYKTLCCSVESVPPQNLLFVLTMPGSFFHRHSIIPIERIEPVKGQSNPMVIMADFSV